MSHTEYDPNKHYDPDKHPTLEYNWGRAWGGGRGWWGQLGNEQFERDNRLKPPPGQDPPIRGGSVLGAAIPLAIIVWLVLSSGPPETPSVENTAASEFLAIPAVTGHKEIDVSDSASLRASLNTPVIVTGTVARVVRNDFGGDGSSFALELYFSETDNVFVYVIPWAAPDVEARWPNGLLGQQVAIRQDRGVSTNSSPIRLGVGAVDEIEVR